jgi:hypothetical protein
LTGNTRALTKFIHKEISITGREDDSTDPWPTFEVISLQQVFDTPNPSLSPSFSNSSTWHSQTNQTYGIRFAHPDLLSDTVGSDMLRPNFASDENVVTISKLSIPQEVYSHTNFEEGSFAIFVNPAITNAQSCSEFRDSDPRFRSTYRVGDTQYTTMKSGGGAMGTYYASHFFNTFQNGLCYEIAFRFAEFNTGNYDTGCTIPAVRESDESKLMEPLIAAVSFVHPAIAVSRESNPRAIPQVTSFEASSQSADVRNRGQITFSWSAQDADYVEFSYRCMPAPHGPGVVILERGAVRGCENANPRLNATLNLNRSPTGSQTVSFANFHEPDPVSITVTVTPFSHATPYPDSSKSITIQVDPFNPFPRGLPSANGNIVLTYSPPVNANGNYPQGSTLKISWQDASSRDPCVNLYLVQDNAAGAATYRLHLANSCLKPPRSGSYEWTIPDKYQGSGYQLFAMAPGGASSGLGPSFSIVRAAH